MERPLTERTGTLLRPAKLRVEDVLERRRERDERELEERDRQDWAEDVPDAVAVEERALALSEVQHDPPVRSGDWHEPEEYHEDLCVHRLGHRQDEVDGDVAAHRWQDLAEDDVEQPQVQRARGLDVVTLFER